MILTSVYATGNGIGSMMWCIHHVCVLEIGSLHAISRPDLKDDYFSLRPSSMVVCAASLSIKDEEMSSVHILATVLICSFLLQHQVILQ